MVCCQISSIDLIEHVPACRIAVYLEEDASETLTIRVMWLVGGNNGLISIIGSGFAMANVFWYVIFDEKMQLCNVREN